MTKEQEDWFKNYLIFISHKLKRYNMATGLPKGFVSKFSESGLEYVVDSLIAKDGKTKEQAQQEWLQSFFDELMVEYKNFSSEDILAMDKLIEKWKPKFSESKYKEYQEKIRSRLIYFTEQIRANKPIDRPPRFIYIEP